MVKHHTVDVSDAYHGALVVVSFKIFLDAVMGGVPMEAEVYGQATYAIPAELWALAVFLSGAPVVIGSRIRGRIGESLIFLASVAGVITQTALAVFSHDAEYGYILSQMCGIAAIVAAYLLLDTISKMGAPA